MREIVVAADLGGTNLRLAAIDADGSVLYRSKRETPRSDSPDEIVQAIIESARDCKSNCAEFEIKAIAAAVPGAINFERGVIMKSPNLPALDGFRLSAALESELNLPTILENDANAAAVGESWLGASRGVKNSIFVTLGTGVGGGIIIGGKVLRGVDGTAGEIGHISVEPQGAHCGCGGRGCVEQYSSATAIVRLANELRSNFSDSSLPEAQLTALEIYQRGSKGDRLALEVFGQMGFYLGVALAGLINVLNPEVIVIGGGASAGWDLFIGNLKEEIKNRTYQAAGERAKIIRAECGDDAGILGAAKLAFES